MEMFRLETSSEANPKYMAWEWGKSARQKLSCLLSTVASWRAHVSSLQPEACTRLVGAEAEEAACGVRVQASW